MSRTERSFALEVLRINRENLNELRDL